jgi:F0F1-type ATP synthase assembly protein I
MAVAGWVLDAFAWTTPLGPVVGTACLIAGLVLFFAGLIWLIVAIFSSNGAGKLAPDGDGLSENKCSGH